MNDIGWVLLLNLVFWISVGSAVAVFWVWGFVALFLGATERARKCAGSYRKASPKKDDDQEGEDDKERHGEAS